MRQRLPDPEKHCLRCGVRMERKRYQPSGQLECRSRFAARKTCGQSCGNSREVVTDSAHRWRAARHRGDECERCGSSEKLHAHHRDGDVTNDDLSNIATLCATCHISGHHAERRAARIG